MRGRLLFSFAFACTLAVLVASSSEARNPRQVIITRGEPIDPSIDGFQAEPDPTDLNLADFRQEAFDEWASGESETKASPSVEAPSGTFGLDATQSNSSCGCGSCGCDSAQCGSDLCDSNLCGNGPYQPFGLAVGVEATYLKPSFQDSNSGLDPEFDNFQSEAAPRVWVQWQWPSRWGVRARYWQFDAEQGLNRVSGPGTTLAAQTFDDELELYAIDLELTRNFNIGLWELCGSFGARNGRFLRQQNLSLTIFDLEGGGGDDASVIFRDVERDLNGTGITMAMGFRRPFLNNRLAAILNLRGSAIWGGNELGVNTTVMEVVPVGAGDLDLNDFTQEDIWNRNTKGLWIGEIQAGGEWRTPLSRDFGGGNAFVQVLFEGQWWNLPGVGTSTISTNDQLYQFVGVTCAAGFTR